MTYAPNSEIITGADLTGSSGSANRTYLLTNDDAVIEQMKIVLAENILQNTINFTFDEDTNTVTFLAKVWDDQPISLDYFTLATAPTPVGPYYADTLQIVRFSGIGVAVELETLGTGDDANKSFDAENGNIIDESYTLYYGDASGDDVNQLSVMTESTHYSIFKDDGRILLLAAGVTLLSSGKLYLTYTYSPKQSDTVLATYLPMAHKEAERITGNYWGSATTSIQYYDGYDSGYPQTDKPFGYQIDAQPEFELDNQGINSITSVIFLDRQGDVERTLDSTEYKIVTDDDGNDSRVVLLTTVPNGKMNIKITYAHGYSTVPVLIQELTALIGGIMALVNISGGSYKDISVYSLERKSFSVGEVYINIRESINQIKLRIDELANLEGGNFFCV